MGLLSKSKTMPKRESHFLKLVHPGGFVELHANPILASEVMSKNPRHCVTRPDFFQYPWIVVRPESILTPGNVFYIVPCHTIRHKIKSTNIVTANTNHTLHFLPNQSSIDPHRQGQISNSNKIRCFQKQSSFSASTSCVKLPREGHKHGKGGNYWAQSSVREKHVYYSSDYTSRDSGKEEARSRSGRFSHSEQIPTLKPCLKKDKSHSTRSRRNLKVRFECNDDNVVNSANFTTKIYRYT